MHTLCIRRSMKLYASAQILCVFMQVLCSRLSMQVMHFMHPSEKSLLTHVTILVTECYRMQQYYRSRSGRRAGGQISPRRPGAWIVGQYGPREHVGIGGLPHRSPHK